MIRKQDSVRPCAAWEAAVGTRPNGHPSAVVYRADRGAWMATGTASNISMDNRKNWKQFDATAYNALSAVSRARA